MTPLPAILLAFACSRIVVALCGYLGIDLLTGVEPGRGKDLLAEAALMWDGAWYWRVAAQGYYAWNPETGSNLAFCPLYPGLTRLGMGLLDLLGLRLGDPTYGNFVLSGLLISNLAFLGALYVLWWLLRIDHSPRVGALVLFLISFFPAGLFWSAIYTESLFMLLVAGSFLCARKGIWWAAAGLAGLAAITRWAGILLAPVLLVEYISQQRRHGRREAGDGRREMGDGRRELGGESQGPGHGRREVGAARRETGGERRETEDGIGYDGPHGWAERESGREAGGERSQLTLSSRPQPGSDPLTSMDGPPRATRTWQSAPDNRQPATGNRQPVTRHPSPVTRHASVLWLVLAPLPLMLYMAWLGVRFGDPFVFLEAEHQGWKHTTSFFPAVYAESAAMLWQSWSGTAGVRPDPVLHYGNGQWLYMLQDLAFGALFAALGVLAFARRWLRPSYLLYLALGIIFPLSTGTTLALTRYLMPLFPAFVVLALLMENRRGLQAAWLALSVALLALTTFYWASGRWMG